MRGRILIAAAIVLALFTASAGAVETHVTVNVVSKDAKFIGTSMGGALVTIRAVDTGELLATGLTAGSTGNTGLLMTQPVTRRTARADANSAKYTATVDIDAPTLVEISARGPMAQRQAIAAASVTQWLIPGKDVVEGDAVMLEIPGFVVDVLAPASHSRFAVSDEVVVRINLTMM